MARATALAAEARFHLQVPDIVIPSSLRDRIEDALGGRRDALMTVGVLIATVVIASLFWMRGAPAKIAPPATTAVPVEAEPSPVETSLMVHVAGAVRRPGLYEVPAGARVADAIEAAGGPLRQADLDQLNLAEVLADGMKVAVPRRGETAMPAATSPSPGATAALVNVNTADAAALETIPGIGPVTAAAIIAHRDANGPFDAIEGLLDVQGIGPATLESLRAYVTI